MGESARAVASTFALKEIVVLCVVAFACLCFPRFWSDLLDTSRPIVRAIGLILGGLGCLVTWRNFGVNAGWRLILSAAAIAGVLIWLDVKDKDHTESG